MKKKAMEQKKGNRLNRIVKTASGLIFAAELTFMTSPVYAANEIKNGMNSLKDLVLGVVTTIGIIMIVKNVLEFAGAYQQQDSSSMNSALKGIVGGLMMAFVGSVLNLLGVK